MAMRTKIPRGYATQIAGPFFVIGDEAPEELAHEFRAGAPADATGYATLKRILGHPDMKPFQCDWEAGVMKLDVRT